MIGAEDCVFLVLFFLGGPLHFFVLNLSGIISLGISTGFLDLSAVDTSMYLIVEEMGVEGVQYLE